MCQFEFFVLPASLSNLGKFSLISIVRYLNIKTSSLSQFLSLISTEFRHSCNPFLYGLCVLYFGFFKIRRHSLICSMILTCLKFFILNKSLFIGTSTKQIWQTYRKYIYFIQIKLLKDIHQFLYINATNLPRY